MIKSRILAKELKQKTQYGDYTTLSVILKCTPDAAKKRIERGNEKALKVLKEIIENREALIKKFES